MVDKVWQYFFIIYQPPTQLRLTLTLSNEGLSLDMESLYQVNYCNIAIYE